MNPYERIVKDPSKIKQGDLVMVGSKIGILHRVYSDGSFEVVYEQNKGEYLAQHAEFSDGKVISRSGMEALHANDKAHCMQEIVTLKNLFS